MAEIRPFRAVRPKNGLAEQIAALPYDVYNREEAKEAVSSRPLSFLRIDRAEIVLGDDVDAYCDEVYQTARKQYEKMLSDGHYVKDSQPAFYLYELTMEGRSQTGIVACASVDDYDNGIIKKHENTRTDKELDRIRHVDVMDAQTGPIFLAYRNDIVLEGIKKQIKERNPLFDFTSKDQIRHRGWIIEDISIIGFIKNQFSQMNQIYIADGHHRCASAVKVSKMRRENKKGDSSQLSTESDYFLCVLFSDEELKIYDYNRVVKDLNGYTTEDFLNEIKKSFYVTLAPSKQLQSDGTYRPLAKGSFGMYLDGCWYSLVAHEKLLSDDPVLGLDVSILQNHLLGPVLHIGDPKTDKRIDFVGGIRGLKELERRCETDCAVAFSMYPTSMKELFDVADAGLLMPPKSTWFEPKLRSGLFIHELETK